MSDVIEQGATRRFRPSDFSGKGRNPALDAGSPKPWQWEPPEFRPARTPRPRGRPAKVFQPKLRPGFGRKLPSRVRGIPFRGGLWPVLLLDFIDEHGPGLWDWTFNPNLKPHLEPGLSNWKVYRDCNTPGPYSHLTRESSACISSPSTNCLTGQAGNWSPLGVPLQPHTHYFAIGRGYYNGSGSKRAHHKIWYKRYYYPPGQNCSYPVYGREARPVRPYAIPARTPELPPNFRRHLPSPHPAPGSQAAPEVKPEPQLLLPGHQFTETGVKQVPPSVRRIPKPDEIEAKRKSVPRSKTAIAAIFTVLDVLSEWGELVKVFYDAIDPKVRRAYEKQYLGGHWVKWQGKWHWWLDPKLSPKYRGFIDQAGQYGISGADWRLPALKAMWRSIDTDKAFRGILANVGTDQLVGLLHKGLGHRAGQVLDNEVGEISQEVAKLMNDLAGV